MARPNYLTKKKKEEPVEQVPETEAQLDQSLLKKLNTRLSVAQGAETEAQKTWKEVVRVLDGKRDVTIGSETSTTKVKYPLLWAAYDNYLSTLTNTPPQTVIEAEGKEDYVKKVYWKGILARAKRKLHLDDLKAEFIDSFIVAGKAVYKVGRRVDVRKDKKVVQGIEQDIEAVVRNESFVEVIDPRKVWLSPETKYNGPVLGENCPYIIEEMIKTPEYLKEKYGVEVEESEKEVISDDEWLSEGSKSSLPDEQQDDIKRVRVYAYYGVCEDQGVSYENYEVLFTKKRILKKRELPYQWGSKKPYIVVYNFKKFFKPIGKGSLDALLDLDREYNEHMNRIRTILRRMASPKYAKLKGAIVDESALLDPDVGLIVDESAPNAFRVIDTGRADPTLFEKATSVEQLFYLLSGIVYGQSSLNKSGTATGQSQVAEGADVKIARMINLTERAQEELDIMLLQLEQQYAPKDGTDVRITGSDVVEMIRNKKKLHQIAVDLWTKQSQQAAEQGLPFEEPQPIDEYEKFQLSEDGRSVHTNYDREDIAGEFELTIVSQSSNRGNRAVKSKQYLDAIDRVVPGGPVNDAELWRRFFSINDEDDLDTLVREVSAQQQPQPGAAQPAVATDQSIQTGVTNGATAGATAV